MTDGVEMATGEHGRTRHLQHEGVGWTVYERTWGDYDRRSATRLVFESEGVVRIVRVFPAEWYSLTDDELVALSWRR
ncbi:MAG: hypothetical protein M3Z10_02845 [Gemmatimonadota bacterium]|nr:hypothetical protein [Gemmatimonadota bacterium]